MAIIGTFTRSADGKFSGSLKTLTLTAPRRRRGQQEQRQRRTVRASAQRDGGLEENRPGERGTVDQA